MERERALSNNTAKELKQKARINNQQEGLTPTKQYRYDEFWCLLDVELFTKIEREFKGKKEVRGAVGRH